MPLGASVTLLEATTPVKLPAKRGPHYSDHYTIRAGRNLPDKEFRYLRTVIVTAAVYRGFSSDLRTINGAEPSP